MDILQKLKFPGMILLSVFLLFAGCHKKDVHPENGISHNDSTALVEILKDISKEHPTMLDLGKITLPDFIVNTDNERIKEFVSMVERFNNLIDNPQDVDSGNLKSSRSVNYKKECITTGRWTTCTYTEDHGDYKSTTIATYAQNPLSINIKEYYSGIYHGTDYGDMFLIQQFYSLADSMFLWEYYHTPEWGEAAGEILFSYKRVTGEKMTIYTPWGIETKRKDTFVSIVYSYDYIKHENHISIESILIMDGDDLYMKTFNWSLRLNDIYISFSGAYSFKNMRGEWCTFDDYGKVIECDKWW